jgi:MYXO-CTERM domain-containing protein
MLLAHAPAQASEEFPGAIQEAAGMPCTPACALCHGVTPGTASTFQNKVLGATLFRLGPVLPHNTDQLKGAYAKYAMDPANAAAVMDLKGGIDPETKTGLCGPTYGCAVHVSQEAPARNLSAPLWVLGAVVVGGLLRRRKRAR